MKKRILIVDDDPGIRDVLQMILQKAGYETFTMGNGSPILEENYELPDIYILDKQLSGRDGLDICRYLKSRQATWHIPVIMVSASPEIGSLSKAAGADGYIEKPFRSLELLNCIDKYTSQPEYIKEKI